MSDNFSLLRSLPPADIKKSEEKMERVKHYDPTNIRDKAEDGVQCWRERYHRREQKLNHKNHTHSEKNMAIGILQFTTGMDRQRWAAVTLEEK